MSGLVVALGQRERCTIMASASNRHLGGQIELAEQAMAKLDVRWVISSQAHDGLKDQQIIILNRSHIDHLLGSSESALGAYSSMVSGGKRLKPKIGSGRDCFAIERRVCDVRCSREARSVAFAGSSPTCVHRSHSGVGEFGRRRQQRKLVQRLSTSKFAGDICEQTRPRRRR
jgi:hypothetical protein